MKFSRTDRSLLAWMLYCCVLFNVFACSIGHGQMVGMQLNGRAFAPSVHDLHRNGRLFPPNHLHESWLDFLYWDVELDP